MTENPEIKYVRIDELRPDENNPRTITPEGIEKIKRSIQRFGFVNPIIAQKGTGLVIAGHQRLKAAKETGLVEVPVLFVQMEDSRARAYNVADNRLSQESTWDPERVLENLEDLEDRDLSKLVGFTDEELAEFKKADIDVSDFFKVGDGTDPGELKGETFTCPKCGTSFTE